MRILILTVLAALSVTLHADGQTTKAPREFVSKELSWKIQIPEGFETVPVEEMAKLQSMGAESVEKTYGTKVKSRPEPLFSIRSDRFNYFQALCQPLDSATGDFLKNFKKAGEKTYGILQAQMPEAVLDSTWSETTIDGKVFQTFRVSTVLPNKMQLDVMLYSRVFGKKQFTVNITTIDKEKQRELVRAWQNSKFDTR
jgi:hypothetical protein